MGIGMRVAPVYESLAPVPGCKLSARDGDTLEIQGGKQPNPVGQSCVSHHGGLDQPDFAESAAAGDGVRSGIHRYRVGADTDPWRRLALARSGQQQKDQK